MTETIDNGFQRVLVKECVDEILRAKRTDNKEGFRAIADLMKRYEERIFDQHYRKPVIAPMPVPVQAPQQIQQQRIERQEATSPGLQYPFVGDGSYHANYPRLQQGYNPNIHPQAQFQQQQQQQPQFQFQQQPQPQLQQQNPLFQDPRLQSSLPYQPGANFVQGDIRYFNDLQSSAKFPGPHGYDPNYGNPNAFINRPLNDMGGQAQFVNPQIGGPNTFGLPQNQINPFIGGNPPPEKSPYYQEDNRRLSRNIELLGGIERTLPNMQMSLNNNELRNIERNYQPQGQQHDTSNYRLNTLLQMNAPQYDQHNIRNASPARGEYFNQYESQYLREDPQLSNRGAGYQSPARNFATEPDLQWNPYTNARSRDPSQDRRPNSARKTGLSSSKDLRNEKAELLGMKFSTPGAHYERDYYN